MKKFIIISILSLGLGLFIGKNIILKYQEYLLNKKDKYYFLLEGVYQNNEWLELEKANNIKNIIIEYENDRMYTYLAITRDLEIAEKIMNMYEENNTILEIKEKYLQNEEFKNNVEQLDLLIKSSSSKEEILKIEEVVLANYEELIKNRDE